MRVPATRVFIRTPPGASAVTPPARVPATQQASALPDFAARSSPGEEELFHKADLINEERAEAAAHGPGEAAERAAA